MADWPDTELLRKVLDIDDDTWDDHLDGVVAAAILRVQMDVGNWVEYEDIPDDSLSKAALRMAELMATRPNATETELDELGQDKTYMAYMKGHRRVFGFA